MVGRRGNRRANSASSRPQMGSEQCHVETTAEQPRPETTAEQPRLETTAEQPRLETTDEQPRPNENVGNLTLEQLGRFITQTVKEAMRKNQESMFSEEQTTRQEREKNAEGHQSRVEETQPLSSGENIDMGEMWREIWMLRQFASSKKHQKNYLSMFVKKQQESETLREFIQRFNGTTLEIPTASPDIMISDFTQGLRGGEFFKSLVKKPPSNYDDLLSRAEKYVNLEDGQRHKRMEQRLEGSRVEGAERGGSKRGAGEKQEDKSRGRGQFSSHVPLDRSRDELMERGKGQGQDVSQEPVEPRRGMDEDNHPTRGIIHMISGGATDGDFGRARKEHGRRLENFEISRGADLPQDHVISLGLEDLRGVVTLHNDALVNYDVAMIFIDNGSPVNVLFKSTLDQMKVEGFEFEPVSTPLYGFAGHATPPLGQIVLPLSLGNDPRRVTQMIAFTVVDIPSAYNGILGRPALKDFRAVASTYHQKLKFHVEKMVGVLCGDQKVARRCYEKVVREERKRARVEVYIIRKGRSG
ncbi:uncharacterized protein [Primulina huaijiensis]|uniref:uncharacterized protein n=1 Tax=Primulina huaijiensis TaxID=1492673 RepID=UPI003CC757AD